LFKKDNLETPLDKVSSVIGKDTFFKGNIDGKGLIRIDGGAEGSIVNKGDVVVGESGTVSVDLKANNVTIAGKFNGSIDAAGKLELKRTAAAQGTFKAKELLVEDGAFFDGSMEMKKKDGSSETVSGSAEELKKTFPDAEKK
jgi:cytoskeletal protein CcmA (bactofilin family)